LIDAVVLKRLRIEVRDTRPSDPGSVGLLQDGSQRAYEPTWTDRPLIAIPGNRKSVCHDDDALNDGPFVQYHRAYQRPMGSPRRLNRSGLGPEGVPVPRRHHAACNATEP